MTIEAWWPRLAPETREWLIENNGDVVPTEIIDEITAVSGSAAANARWCGEVSDDGITLSDDVVDWIEAIANEEEADPE